MLFVSEVPLNISNISKLCVVASYVLNTCGRKEVHLTLQSSRSSVIVHFRVDGPPLQKNYPLPCNQYLVCSTSMAFVPTNVLASVRIDAGHLGASLSEWYIEHNMDG